MTPGERLAVYLAIFRDKGLPQGERDSAALRIAELLAAHPDLVEEGGTSAGVDEEQTSPDPVLVQILEVVTGAAGLVSALQGIGVGDVAGFVERETERAIDAALGRVAQDIGHAAGRGGADD